jgi:bifunctional ADP-heptose synthase (sugar kinase/adenylyltransferase)
MNRDRLVFLLSQFPGITITVFGDLFLDKWFHIDRRLDEPSVETGLNAYQAVGVTKSAEAAGTVLNNLKALQVGTCYAVSFLGMDGDGWEVLQALKSIGVDTRHVVRSRERMTPVYMKPMFSSGDGSPQESNRIDIRNRTATPESLEKKMALHLQAALRGSDAVVILDQLADENTGVVTNALREEIASIARAEPGRLFFADSRAFIHRFHDVTIKCNHLEAVKMALGREMDGFSRSDVFEAMGKLESQTGKSVFITCGANGVACKLMEESCLVPAVNQPGPIDVCGAGDACTAGIVSALCAGADKREAAFIGNLVSGVTVRKIGTTGTASPEEIIALYDEQFGGKAE